MEKYFRRANLSGVLNPPGPLGPGFAKIMATAISYLRLALPSRWRLVLGRRARPPGRAAYICGPASVRPLRKEGTASISAVGAAISARAFPLQGGRCPRRGRMRVTFWLESSTAGALGTPLPNQGVVPEDCGGGAEGESAEGREKPPWGVPLPTFQDTAGGLDRPLQKDRNASTFSVGAGVLTRPLWKGSPFVGCGLPDAPSLRKSRNGIGYAVRLSRT